MKSRNKFWWFVAIAALFIMIVVVVMALLFWQQLSPHEKIFLQEIFAHNFAYVFAAGFLLIVSIGFAIDWVFRLYLIPLSKLSEEIELIHSVNPSHRIKQDGDGILSQLVKQINRSAEKYENLNKNVFKTVQIAKAELEEEKNILAAIMAELPDAVLICNREGKIILFNSQAKRFFYERKQEDNVHLTQNGNDEKNRPYFSEKRYIGIGRSIYGLIDKPVIRHALDEIHTKLAKGEESVISRFVTMAKENRLLRAEAVPILNAQKDFSGFIIIFSDITRSLREEYRSGFLLRNFLNSTRHSTASIGSAIEIIREYPDMEASRLSRLKELIYKESKALGQLIANDSGKIFKQFKTEWPLIPISMDDLLELARKKALDKPGINLKVVPSDGACWVRVDTYSIVLTLLIILDRIKATYGADTFACKHYREGDFILLDLIYSGKPVKIDTLRKWETLELSLENEGMPIYLKEVLDHHEADIWSYADPQMDSKSCLRFYLPVYRPYEQDEVRQGAILTESRPEMYDFDLFSQPGQTPDLDHRLLNELVYTVFDTETTGLNPRGGDKIISIGAVRIVNLRLLKPERFDHLINPERNIPYESTRVHGIDNKMVIDQPTVDAVLPTFHRFTEDTILVAHNAAFDMRMLQICEERTHIKFINPVLDTLLLSAAVHPNHEDHSLEAIAGRLGVEIHNRHTALGDAMMTAEIFLKLIPLLESMGLRTLKEVREASEKTYYARLKY